MTSKNKTTKRYSVTNETTGNTEGTAHSMADALGTARRIVTAPNHHWVIEQFPESHFGAGGIEILRGIGPNDIPADWPESDS